MYADLVRNHEKHGIKSPCGNKCDTPANQLRILEEQVTLAGRAIGNIFIPVLSDLLPYVTAAVQVIYQLASAFALLVGYEITEIDYSTASLDSTTSSLTDVEDAATAASDAVTTLIGGFDELNTMPEVTTSTSTDDADSSANILSDIDLPTYDIFEFYVASEVDAIVANWMAAIDDIVDALEPLSPLLEGIAVAAGVAFATATVLKFAAVLSGATGITSAITTISALSGVLTVMGAGALAGTVSLAELSAAVTGVLGPVVTLVAGFASAAGLIYTTYSTVYQLTQGTIELGGELEAAVLTIGLFGTALAVITGTAALPVVLALSTAFLAVASAETDMVDASISAEFYDGIGTSITALTDNYTTYINTISDSADAINSVKTTFDSNIESTEAAAESLFGYFERLRVGGDEVIDVYAPEIAAAIDEMYESASANLSLVSDAILTSINGSMADALETLGVQTGEVITYLSILESGASESMYEAKMALEELNKQYQETKDPALLDQMEALTLAYINQESGASDLEAQLAAIEAKYSEISWGSPETATASLEALQTEYAAILEELDAAKASSEEYWDLLIGWQSDPALAEMGENVKNTFLSAFDVQASDATEASARIVSALQTSLDEEMVANEYAISETVVGGVKAAINGAVTVIQGGTFMDGVGESLANQADEAMGSVGTALENAAILMATEARGYGANTVEGYVDGIEDDAQTAYDAMTSLGKSIMEAFHGSALDFGSPSKAMTDYGLDTITGYANGVDDNVDISTDAMDNMADKVLDVLDTSLSLDVMKTLGKDIPSGIGLGITASASAASTAMSSLMSTLYSKLTSTISSMQSYASSNPIVVSVTYSSSGYSGTYGTTSYSIPQLASGGVAYEDTLVNVAEYANANSDPEIIAPQSIMAETVAEANTPMAVAIVSAIQSLQATLEEKDMEVYIGDEDVGKAAVRYATDSKIRTGKNPLL